VRNSETDKLLISGPLAKLIHDAGADDFSYSGYASVCFPDFQGVVLAFQAGATGLGMMFVVFESTPQAVGVAHVFNVTGGRFVVDTPARVFTLYDRLDEEGCEFCGHHYKLTTFAIKDSKIVK